MFSRISSVLGWGVPTEVPRQTVERNAFPCVPRSIAASVTAAIASRNCFSSPMEKEVVLQMAALAQLMYQGPSDPEAFSKVNRLFNGRLEILPEAKGLPTGLFVQAFRYGNQVIIGIRGTELTKDKSTMAMNLLADMGIGRHKSNEDLLSSIEGVRSYVGNEHRFSIPDSAISAIRKVVDHRVVGHTDAERQKSFATKVITEDMSNGAAAGAKVGSFVGTALATGLAVTGFGLPLAAAVFGMTTLTCTSGGAVIAAVPDVIGGLATSSDGYSTLLGYVKAIDAYIKYLNESSIIEEGSEIITVGHSLGGYLAGLLGHIHADKIFAFNGPGVSSTDVEETINNLGLTGKRKLRSEAAYYSYSMRADFIGNLGARMGRMTPIHFPGGAYAGPLDHHGIDAMIAVMKRASVPTIPREIASRLFVVINDAPPFPIYPPKGVLLLTDRA